MIIGLTGLAGSGKDTVAQMLAPDHVVRTKRVFVDEWDFVRVPLPGRASVITLQGTQIAFADPLKVICKSVFDFSWEQLWGSSEERNRPDPRYLHTEAGSNGSSDMRWAIAENAGLDPVGHAHIIKHLDLIRRHDGFLPSPPTDEYLTPREALQKLGTEWGRQCCPDIWIRHAMALARDLESPGRCVVISDARMPNEAKAIRDAGGQVWRVVRPGAETGEWSAHSSERLQDEVDPFVDLEIVNDGTLDELRNEVGKFFARVPM